MLKNAILIVMLALLPLVVWADLPACYNTYDEVCSQLYNLEEAYSDIAKVHVIGYSQEEQVPILAMQISGNINGTWQKPALLFVGQVHAEEVLGLQITLSNIQHILQRRYLAPYNSWINQLDTWWIPTLNPEGHNVVTANLDTSYRKNKRDNNNNGVFDYSPLVGYDIDGVDINRNFDFNWVHGDTLYQPGGTEVYDYYGGPYPMSESEVQAIKRLSDEKKFVFSICWHSSRSGNFSEKVYYSFNWKDVRPSPDLAFAHSIAQGVANQINKESSGTYEYYPNASRRGAFHDWMYKEYGTIQLLIECGTRNLQPEEPLMLDTIQRCNNGVWWMLNRALNYSSAVPSNSLLTGHTTDGGSGEPISAEIIITERHAPWFVPRLSDPDTGRFYKPLPAGNFTVKARKKGYWDTILPNTEVMNSSWTTIEVQLNPKAPAVMYGSVNCGSSQHPARMIIKDVIPDTLYVAGDYIFHGYEGEYDIEITAEGYYPYIGRVNLSPGSNMQHYYLSPETVLFSEDFETDTAQWEIEGPWVRITELSESGHAITDSWGGKGHYLQNCNVWIKTASPISIPAGSAPLLTFESHLYTEWDFDPVRVEVSTDNETWTQLWINSGRQDWWQNVYIDLADYAGQSVYLRFRLQDSSTADELTDPGWTLDNIRLITGSALANADEVNTLPLKALLKQNYPNPFNPETTISYSLAKAQEIEIQVFNLKGQLLRSHRPGTQTAGEYKWVFDGKDRDGMSLASGVYFYRLLSPENVIQKKMLLMK
ncbi:MAG: M14 family zinc carboxypeptidase [Candidatus Cloacimonetes bacterium]|nr:M14 family zinc carboxypeptidase [Candidatus Cloacimonadota bacterium]